MFTMTPHLRSTMPGSTWRIILNAPKTWTRKMASQSSGSISTMGRSPKIPALFTRMSTRPNRSVAERTMPRHVSKSPTSPGATWMRLGGPKASATARSASVFFRALRTTFEPASASMEAVARPIPRDEPVTMATEPRISTGLHPAFKSLSASGVTVLTAPAESDASSRSRRLRLSGIFRCPGRFARGIRLLEPPLGDWIPFEHDAIPRCDREDVRRHRLEFRIGHFDEIETPFTKELPERRREKPRIDDGEVVVQDADE